VCGALSIFGYVGMATGKQALMHSFDNLFHRVHFLVDLVYTLSDDLPKTAGKFILQELDSLAEIPTPNSFTQLPQVKIIPVWS
jgi:hypothetical protein